MAKADVLDILRSKKMDPMEFHFENLWIPPIYNYLTPQDIEELHKIATSVRLSSKIHQKYKMIDDIMRYRGFKRFSAGTNRVVYRYLDDDRFLVKIAVDRVGMQDNPLEYKNQFLLQPFVTKMFYVSPCGTVGFSERVLPVKNKEEFKLIASDVFDILINKILGVYVVEDVGTKYFMNWGIRLGFGPVLLDYPYVYKLDGNRLFCTKPIPETGQLCDGEIDYDQGFNHLVCTKCGKIYLATNLRDDSEDNKIVIKKGGIQMRVVIMKGDKVIAEPIPMDDVMVRPTKKKPKNTKLIVGIKRPNQEIQYINDDRHDSEDIVPIKEYKAKVESEYKGGENVPSEENVIPIIDNKTSEESKVIDNTDKEDPAVTETVPNVEQEPEVVQENEENREPETEEVSNNTDDAEDIVLASDVNLNRKKNNNHDAYTKIYGKNDYPYNKKGKGKKYDKRRSTFIPSRNYDGRG